MTGELLRETQAFAQEDRATTWRLLAEVLLAIAAAHAATLLVPYWPAKLAGATLLGLLNVRLFIFFHDAQHGAIFRGSGAGQWIMAVVGHYLLAPPSYWRFSHNRHHARNGEMVGSLIGEFPLVDTATWRAMPARERLVYRFIRSPVNVALSYLTVFLAGHCLFALFLDPRRHWAASVTLAAHFGGLAALLHALGWQAALFDGLLPVLIAAAFGGALFYVQHSAQGLRYQGRGSRDLVFAALHSTTMLGMGPVMHWFTGNIGYHHVHHVNPSIPFYRLPEAMARIPQLQSPTRVTWTDLRKCMGVSVWDPHAQRMVSYREAAAIDRLS